MPNVTTARAREGLSFELEERVLERFPWRKDAIRVLATHIGAGRDRDLAAKFRFAAILGGHSHSKVAEKLGDVQILQSQCWGIFVGRLELTIRDGVVVSVEATHETVDRKVEDAAVKAIIAKYAPQIDEVMDEVVGELAQDLPSGSRDKVESSPLGNHLTDVMRASCDAAVALHNRTGIRAGLKKGVQKLRDIYTVSPFGNTIVVVTMTGADLWALLEGSLGDGTRLLLEMSGAEIVFDPAAEKGKRLVSVSVGGKPLDRAGSYRVATNSFLAEGGDGHSPFVRGKDRKDTMVTLLDAHRAALAKERPLRCEFRNRIVAKP
jgi:2',3'-cyclic-nucleotide 2'-phosphodiesterase/3'-nucleotidase